jgi:hypothetical protein
LTSNEINRRRPPPLRPATGGHASALQLEQLAADEHAADLGRPGADLVELGVAQEPTGRYARITVSM